jgi:hypothetical protein
MTDTAPAPAPAATPVGVSALDGPATPEEARAAIEAKIGDKDFYAKIKAQDPIARQEWDRLHKIAYPAPVASGPQHVSEQMRREAAQREQGLMTLAEHGGLNATQVGEIRNRTPVTREEHDFAVREKDRMIKDAGFRQRLLSHDRTAANEWFRVVQLSALPVRP